MKTIEFGKMNGYPQYLQIKLIKGGGIMIYMCVDPNNKPEKGDTIQKFNDTYNVLEVVEERPAKGKHQPGILWQRLKCS